MTVIFYDFEYGVFGYSKATGGIVIDTISLLLDIRDPNAKISFDPKFNSCWHPNIEKLVRPYSSFGSLNTIHKRQFTREENSDKTLPRLSLGRWSRPGGLFDCLRITFSAPKLLFGNNFNELSDKDFEIVCRMLSDKLKKMGISVELDAIKNAFVSEIHFSKNIIFKDGVKANTVISILNRAHISTYNDVWARDYEDGGKTLRLHQEKYEFVVYDKKQESKSNLNITTGFLDARELPDDKDALRLEARCRNPNSIRRQLKKVGITPPNGLPFCKLFNTDVSRAILLRQMQEIRSGLVPILLTQTELVAYEIAGVLSANPDMNPVRVANAVITASVIKECNDGREAKNLLGLSNAQWRKRLNDMKVLNPAAKVNDCLDTIGRQLDNFSPIVYPRVALPTP